MPRKFVFGQRGRQTPVVVDIGEVLEHLAHESHHQRLRCGLDRRVEGHAAGAGAVGEHAVRAALEDGQRLGQAVGFRGARAGR